MDPERAPAAKKLLQSRRLLTTVAALLVMLSAACGGGGKSANNGAPVLAGTEIPTVSPVPATVASCAPPQQLALPANFPREITVPPDYVIWSVETTPHLRVVGRVTPPASPTSEVPKGVVADAILAEATAGGWQLRLHQGPEALDYDFTLPDGREGNFTSGTAPGCPGQVILTFDANWVTG